MVYGFLLCKLTGRGQGRSGIYPEVNEYNGRVSPQMVLQDIHCLPQAVHLDRKVMVDIYIWHLSTASPNRTSCLAGTAASYQCRSFRLRAHTACAAMLVLREIGVLDVRELPDGPAYYFPALTGKMHLEASSTYEKYYRAEGGR